MKNKIFKTLVSVLLVTSMAAAMIGCGSESSTNESKEESVSKEESKSSEASKEELPKDEDPVHLTWYMYGPEKTGLAEVNEKMSEYTLEKLNCTVELVNIPTDYATKMRLLLAGGADVDIMFTSNSEGFYEFASQGVFAEISDLLDEYGQDIKAIMPEYFYESAKLNGELYALPSYKDAATNFNLVYKLVDGEKYGINPDEIKSVADLEPYLEAFKEDYPDSYPLGLTGYVWRYYFTPLDIIPLSYNYNLCIYIDKADETKLINPFETDKMMDHLKLMHEYYNKGYISPDVATLMAYPEPWLFQPSETLPYQTEVDNLSREDKDKQGEINWRQPILHSTAPSMNAITASCENPEKAMEFLNLVNTDVYLKNLVTYGIEGKHFVLDEEGFRKLPDGVTSADLDYSSYSYTLGNTYINYSAVGTPKDKNEKYIEYDNNSYKSPSFGFYLDQTGLETEIAAINNVYLEYRMTLFTGAVDPEVYLPEFVEKLKVAGYDKVLEEAQKQFDAWRAIK